ncbi:MAG: hypothetical protein GVY14_02000 [Spirochaetes bacterium]|nr:hypothetical protein [Spirochaetota bacterium]
MALPDIEIDHVLSGVFGQFEGRVEVLFGNQSITVGRSLLPSGRVLAEQSIHVDAARRYREGVSARTILQHLYVAAIGNRGCHLEAVSFLRHAAAADHVDGFRTLQVRPDRDILIPVGIEGHAALLLQYAVVLLVRIVGETRKIAFHND